MGLFQQPARRRDCLIDCITTIDWARPRISATIGAMRLKGVYYGWFVVAALCITETVPWGIISSR
jgi:hypothetical protein